MFFLLLNRNVKFNQTKKRGGAPVSGACKQCLHRSKVARSPSRRHLLWLWLGGTWWTGAAGDGVWVVENQVRNALLGWGTEGYWAQQLTPSRPAPVIGNSSIDKERLKFLPACSSKNASVIFFCFLDTVLQIRFKEIFAWERTFGLSWRHVTIFHSQLQMHCIQLPKKSAFASLSSFPDLVIGFQLV